MADAIVTPAKPLNHLLPAGNAFTVTANSAGGTAIVSRYRTTPLLGTGQLNLIDTTTIVRGGSTIFGPYNQNIQLSVTATGGRDVTATETVNFDTASHLPGTYLYAALPAAGITPYGTTAYISDSPGPGLVQNIAGVWTIIGGATNITASYGPFVGGLSVFQSPFNAVGDWTGSAGTDDTVAIQAAITYALAHNIRKIYVGNHLVTDLNLTNLGGQSGIVFEGLQHNVYTGGGASIPANICVTGSTSQGLDISGTSNLIFRDIIFLGDPRSAGVNAPRCALFAARTTTQQPHNIKFENGGVLGQFSKAGIYDYGGEEWGFWNHTSAVDVGHNYYFTTKNSLALTSKFVTTDSGNHLTVAFNNTTHIKFYGGQMLARGAAAHGAWFEGSVSGGFLDSSNPIATVGFYGTYFNSGKGSGSASGSTILLENVVGNVEFTGGNLVETITVNPDTFIEITGTNANSVLVGLTIEGNTLYPYRYIVDASAGYVSRFSGGKSNLVAQSGGYTTLGYLFGSLKDSEYSLHPVETLTVSTTNVNNRIRTQPGYKTAVTLPADTPNLIDNIVAQSAIPMILAPTGSMGNNGAITLGTALGATYSDGCYMRLPANAIVAGSAAGIYYVVMSSTTVGVVYNNLYTGGTPIIPAAPTAFVTTGPGAYAQVINTEFAMVTATIPANALGPNGEVQVDYIDYNNNTAGTKGVLVYLGASQFNAQFNTTTTAGGALTRIRNAGKTNKQRGYQGYVGDPFVGGSAYRSSIDTTAAAAVTIKVSSTVATDWVLIEGFSVKLYSN